MEARSIVMSERLRKRFEQWYMPLSDVHVCWPWTGPYNRNRGRFKLRVDGHAVYYLAYRVSYMLYHGLSTLDQELILHQCNNPRCINPHHLVSGDQLLNMQHKVSANRQARGADNGGGNKLTATQVIEIKKQRAIYGATIDNLAEQFMVDRTMISLIINGKKWAHVKFDPIAYSRDKS